MSSARRTWTAGLESASVEGVGMRCVVVAPHSGVAHHSRGRPRRSRAGQRGFLHVASARVPLRAGEMSPVRSAAERAADRAASARRADLGGYLYLHTARRVPGPQHSRDSAKPGAWPEPHHDAQLVDVPEFPWMLGG